MKNAMLVAALASALVSTAAYAQAPSVADRDFVAKASVGNTFEMEEAKLALEKATDARLNGFAQKMIADHGDAMKKLADAAGKAGDKAGMMLDAPHLARPSRLRTSPSRT